MEGTDNDKLNIFLNPNEELPPYLLVRWLLIGALLGFILLPYFKIGWVYLACLSLIWLISGQVTGGFGKKHYWLIVGLIIALFRGIWVVDFINQPILTGKYNQFEAIVYKSPKLKDSSKVYFLKTATGQQVTAVTRFYPEYYYGDKLLVNCSNALWLESFYKNKPGKLICSWPDLELISRPTGGFVYKLYGWRVKLAERLSTWLHEPYAALASGMLWGDDSSLPKEISEFFRKTGTTHLLAVSGYNVVVLTSLLFWLLISLSIKRRLAGWLTVAAVIVFVVFTGAEAATIRAGFMSIIIIAAYSLGRKINKLNLFLLTAGLMLSYQPAYLYDLGWQLSFAALGGLIWLSPRLKDKLFFVTKKFNLRSVAADTLAANFTTLPLILIELKQLSLISPLSNLLIGPAVILVFVFGLSLLILPSWLVFLKIAAAWCLQLVLSYMIGVVKILASLPLGFLQSASLAWLGAAVVYLGFFNLFIFKKSKK